MSSLNTAKKSPRIEDGKFYWYEGNTFAIELEINLSNENGETITLSDTDTIIINCSRNDISIHKFTFREFFENKIVLNFDEELTKKFRAGSYEYTITYIGTNITTIVAKNIMEVEK